MCNTLNINSYFPMVRYYFIERVRKVAAIFMFSDFMVYVLYISISYCFSKISSTKSIDCWLFTPSLVFRLVMYWFDFILFLFNNP